MMSDPLFDKYVKPLLGYTDGVAVCVGNYIITAGHTLLDGALDIYVRGKAFRLDKDNALFFATQVNNERTFWGYDLAVFEFSGIDSPLKLSSAPPSINTNLISISFVRSYTTGKGILFGGDKIETRICNAMVKEIEGNYFSCEMAEVFAPGTSGSPVFLGNEIEGLLCFGEEGTRYCAFQSSESIITRLPFLPHI